MPDDLSILLERIRRSGTDLLCFSGENNYPVMSFEDEQALFRTIYDGDPSKTVLLFSNYLSMLPSSKAPQGHASYDNLKYVKYAAVSAVSVACRTAVLGGALRSVSYSKYNEAVVRIDRCSSVNSVLEAEIMILSDYAKLVETIRSKKYSKTVKDTIDYIIRNSHANITLEDLASGKSISKEYLAKLFRAETGVPVSKFILKTRIDEAKELLSSGKSCLETSNILGFSSQSYFIRQFKNTTGLTPTEFINTV